MHFAFLFLLAAGAAAQQYAGEVISAYLPTIPGAEVAFFKIQDPSGSDEDLTLINYYAHGTDRGRIRESNIQRVVIPVHGLLRDPWNYINDTLNALAVAKTMDSNINVDTVAVMAPYFTSGDDRGFAYPWTEGLRPHRGSTSSALVWPGSQWISGGNNQYPYRSTDTSSFDVMDSIIRYFDNQTLFPNLNQIVLLGHSAGGQMLHRYAALGDDLETRVPVTYWIGNPNSYLWLEEARPLSTADCPEYDEYREGLSQVDDSVMTYGAKLVAHGRQAVLDNYNKKQIAYARAMLDHGDTSSDCRANTTGNDRHERLFFFIDAFQPTCHDPASDNCDTVDLIQVSHDNGKMFESEAGLARIFTDNFYGNRQRAYDFGYPRAQLNDDPYPNPTLVSTPSKINYNHYAADMTYQGCWTNQDPITPPALPTMLYDDDSNTIEACTGGCSSRGFSIAGIQNATQCFCGNAMNRESAVLVVDTSCRLPCPGNAAEICGSINRFSIFSTGFPMFK